MWKLTLCTKYGIIIVIKGDDVMYTATLSKSAFEKLKKFEPGKNLPLK